MSRSIIVDNLRCRFEGVAGVGVASMYCNYKEQLEQTPVNLLAGLWMQLVHRSNQLNDEVKSLYYKHADRNTLPTLTDVEKILSNEIE